MPTMPTMPTTPTTPKPSVAGSAAPMVGTGPAAGTGGAPTDMEPTNSTEPGASTPPEQPAESTGPGMLTVSFTSVGPGGRYAPRNCGAVWIEDESGEFVKTIERWTAIRERYLENWSMASGGWGFSFLGGSTATNPDQVDVVSAGTLSRHQMHMSKWNMKNVEGQVVPDGKYTVVVEVSEGNAEVGRVDFVKGPMPQMLKGESPVFSNMTVTYSP